MWLNMLSVLLTRGTVSLEYHSTNFICPDEDTYRYLLTHLPINTQQAMFGPTEQSNK